ncbi:MAG: carboxypeptidase-like regulatory domain-containing protein, partial [Ginsengibacter sp.]
MRINPTSLRLWILSSMLIFSNLIFAQQKTISGSVTEASTGKPVIGTTVSVKGSNVATQTNEQGSFTLSVPNSAKTLTVTSVGFESQEISINGQSQIAVLLKTATSSLNEVVVVGYGTQRRKDVTGSISSINAATIAKVPVTTLDQALQGRAPGVQIINNDASPGGNISVLI